MVGGVSVGHAPAGCAEHSPGAVGPQYFAPPPGRLATFFARWYARSPRWLAPLGVLACFAGAAAYVLVSDPTDGKADAVPSCLLKYLTGLDCPGCGGTRAFYYLLHGNVSAAARHHLLFVFAVPFLTYLYVSWVAETVFGRKLPKIQLSPFAVGMFLAVWGAWSVARNLPWAPFTWFYV